MNSPTEIRVGPEGWDRVIAHATGPQLVVAGPGTGKTEFLVRRTIHLIEERIAKPEEITVLTFSRRAAKDLQRRILAGLTRSVTAIGSSTFHSFARRLIETFDDASPRELLTGPEQIAVVAELLGSEDRSRWPPRLRPLLSTVTFAADLADFLLRCAERSIGPDALADRGVDDWAAIPDFMRSYEAELVKRNRLDYALLINHASALFADAPVATRIRDQHRFVLVDEYQDTSPAQADLLEVLTRGERNITVTGDPYQSVYSFRGAELTNVDRFPMRFCDEAGIPATRIVLTTSRRVPAEILDAALRITSKGDLPGSAGPVTPASHRGVVEVYVFDQGAAEADWIAQEVERMHLVDGIPFSDIAVLLRSKRRLLPELSRALTRHGVPHDPPDSRLVDHPAVQLIFDLAKVAGQDRPGIDAELDRAMRRILLGPLLATPLGVERRLLRARHHHGRSWQETLAQELPEAEPLFSLLHDPDWAIRSAASEGFWRVWQGALAPLAMRPDLADHRMAWSSFAQTLERQRERDPSVTLLDYRQITFEEDFEATPLISFRSNPDRLTLTTLHQAKGLEFDTTFIADADDSTFPDLRRGISLLGTHRLSGDTSPRARLQEEIRLAYTAMCRARRRVVWTATAAGIDEGDRRPSRFLVAVSGVADRSQIGAPSTALVAPTTRHELEVLLRRSLTDAGAPAADRLAAATVLASRCEVDRFAGFLEPGPDTGIVKSDSRLSPSQAEAYHTCPRRYVLERRLGIGDGDSAYAMFGTLVHDVLERLERQLIDGEVATMTVDQATGIIDQVWQQDARFGSPLVDDSWKQRALRIVSRLIEDWPSDAHHPVKLEYPLTLELDGTIWNGRADRIDQPNPGTLRIVDHKTSTSIASAQEAANSLQLGFYVLAARADPELRTFGTASMAELWYPAVKAKNFRRSFSMDQLPSVRDTLVEIGIGIRTENWEPISGAHCVRCPVRRVCPLWPEGAEGFIP